VRDRKFKGDGRSDIWEKRIAQDGEESKFKYRLGQNEREEGELDGIGPGNDGSLRLPRSGVKMFCGLGLVQSAGTNLQKPPYFGYLGPQLRPSSRQTNDSTIYYKVGLENHYPY
jgi:hypothetical protein